MIEKQLPNTTPTIDFAVVTGADSKDWVAEKRVTTPRDSGNRCWASSYAFAVSSALEFLGG